MKLYKKVMSRTIIGVLDVVFVLGIIAGVLPVRVSAYAGGDGTELTPYQIASCADFMEIPTATTDNFVLTQSLDCSADGNNIMRDEFRGNFDGDEFTIQIELESTGSSTGLFKWVSQGTIQNLGVTGSVASTASDTGMLAGQFYDSTALNIEVSGTVLSTAERTGGVFGSAGCSSEIENIVADVQVTGTEEVGGITGLDACEGPGGNYDTVSVDGDVTGQYDVGGLIGEANYTDITVANSSAVIEGLDRVGGLLGAYSGTAFQKIFHSSATGSVTGSNYVGGLIGMIEEGTVSQSFATGAVTTNGGDNVGGLAGTAGNEGRVVIRDSYSRGTVTSTLGEGSIAGFIGEFGGARVFNSYTTSQVTSLEIVAKGAFAGDGSTDSIYNSFWDADTATVDVNCYQNSSCDATGVTTVQMKTASTFSDAGWNLTDVWQLDEGQNDGYPSLRLGADQSYQVPNDSPRQGPEEVILGENQFSGGGDAMGWNGDDDEWQYDLPFTFNFYGQEYNTVYVSSNGYVGFSSDVGSYDFYIEEGEGAPVIVAMSGDLDTDCGNEGEDIYVTDEGDGKVIFRWQAGDHRNCSTLLNFEIVLNSDNTFQLNYGDMEADLEGTGAVGVHDGGRSYVASVYNERTNFDNLNTSSWDPAPIPETTTQTITTCEQLVEASYGTSPADTILLQNDVDCSGIEGFSGLDWGGDFTGVFDGQGHTISNLAIVGEQEVGLFVSARGGELKNVHFDGGVAVADQSYVGMLAGGVNAVDVYNVSSNAEVIAGLDGMGGGLIGFVTNEYSDKDMMLSNLSSSGPVSGYDDIGGLFGELELDEAPSITLRKSFATGDVTNFGEGDGVNFGGLIGDLEVYSYEEGSNGYVAIEDVYATGNVSGYETVGGLIGDVSADNDGHSENAAELFISNAYAAGTVTADYNEAGGLFGEVDYNHAGELTVISDSFAAGEAVTESEEGADKGGFIGSYEEAEEGSSDIELSNNYFDNSTGAACYEGYAFEGCTGVDESAQPNYFKANATNQPLSEWDFDSVWYVRSNDYPALYGADTDQDSIADSIESSAPNDGDANNDGTPDYLQANVASVVNPVTAKYATLEVSDECSIQSMVIISETEVSNQADVAYDYTSGLMDFRVDCGTPGFTATFNQYYYGVSGAFSVRKFIPGSGYTSIAGATTSAVTIAGQTVTKATYQITDGTIYDIDATVNGSIEDPAGLATSVLTTPNTGLSKR